MIIWWRLNRGNSARAMTQGRLKMLFNQTVWRANTRTDRFTFWWNKAFGQETLFLRVCWQRVCLNSTPSTLEKHKGGENRANRKAVNMRLTTVYDVISLQSTSITTSASAVKIRSIFGDEIFKSCHGILGGNTIRTVSVLGGNLLKVLSS